jgi:hypothetical protein
MAYEQAYSSFPTIKPQHSACATEKFTHPANKVFPARIKSLFEAQIFTAATHRPLQADSHIACRAHAVPLPCRAAKGLQCVFPIWFTQCGRVWFTLAMPRPCYALTMPFFSRPRHSMAVERRTVGYLPAFGLFGLPRGMPRRLLSEAYQSSSQRSIPATVKSGSRTLQKKYIRFSHTVCN